MAGVGLNRWLTLVIIGEASLYLADFCLSGSLIISQYNQKKGSNNIRKTVAGKFLYIYSPVSCT